MKLTAILLSGIFAFFIQAEGAKWKHVEKSDLKKRLTPLQYEVTQNDGTEPPYRNPFWNNKKPGIYVDVVSGEPLFSSLHKYDSKTGWPSFDRPLVSEHIVKKTDYKLIFPRTEVRSKYGDSHLGHLFEDGPKETTGLRYCINSASLRFVPLEDLEKEGYGAYRAMFAAKGPASPSHASAILAAGCFWCIEADFEKLKGVIDVVSGYTGGKEPNPSYEAVSARKTGHTEAIKITFNPAIVSYEDILAYFWINVDPEDRNGQFCDKGPQYRSGIYPLDEEQKKQAVASMKEHRKKVKAMHTEIVMAGEFYPAEDYHQDYYKKNKLRYGFYRTSCGRDARLDQLWGEAFRKKRKKDLKVIP